MNRAERRKHKRPSYDNRAEVAVPQSSGISRLKKKIRDIERLLRRKGSTMDAVSKLENERALAALKEEIQTAELDKKAKEYGKKYHMVRFFEKKKALRGLKKAEKHLKECSEDEKAEAETAVFERKVDLAYVLNFPKFEKYISLYPSEKDQPTDLEAAKVSYRKRDEFREKVKKMLQDGTLPLPVSDGKTAAVSSGDRKLRNEFLQQQRRAAKGSDSSDDSDDDEEEEEETKKNDKAKNDNDSGDESDFFE